MEKRDNYKILTNTTPTDRRFTGQREESSFGLYFYNARWYDPALGRFIQADSIVPGAGNPQAWDRYAYANNNPLYYTDPTGHWVESFLDISFIVYDIYDISQNGLNWETGLSLAADLAGLALPVVTGGGLAVRAAMHADDVVDAARVVDKAIDAANAADNLTDAISHGDEIGEGLIRAVPIDQVGTSQPFKTFKGEDGLSVFEGVMPEQVLSELPGNRVPNTTVTIPTSKLPPGTRVIPTPAEGLSKILSDAHRILVRPESWLVDRFAKALKEIVGWW